MSDQAQDEQSKRTQREKLLSLMRMQRDLYRRLTELADQQRSLITGNQPSQLLEVLGDRQRLIDRLGTIAEQVKVLQGDWPALRSGMDAAMGEEVDQLIAEINQLLASILERDRADADLLSARRSETASAVKQAKANKAAGAAYAAAVGSTGSRSEWSGA